MFYLDDKECEPTLQNGDTMQDLNADIIRCTQAIELNPKDVSAYLARGRAHRFQGENQEAIDDYSKAIELSPKIPQATPTENKFTDPWVKSKKLMQTLPKPNNYNQNDRPKTTKVKLRPIYLKNHHNNILVISVSYFISQRFQLFSYKMDRGTLYDSIL